MKAQTILFHCSYCGKRRPLMIGRSEYDSAGHYADNMVREGWRSLGSAIYCPKCVRTWADRNGTDDDRLEDAADTKVYILEHEVAQLIEVMRWADDEAKGREYSY